MLASAACTICYEPIGVAFHRTVCFHFFHDDCARAYVAHRRAHLEVVRFPTLLSFPPFPLYPLFLPNPHCPHATNKPSRSLCSRAEVCCFSLAG